MQNFIAIDIQTANHAKSSICCIALVVVRRGRILHRIERLVRPTPNFYSGWAVAFHGITYEDTINAPDFVEVWHELAPKLRGLPLVAHNASFEESCLRAAHKIYAMKYNNPQFFCTLRSSRIRNPELENHDLKYVAELAGHKLEDFHNALADAEACAAIALSMDE